MALVVTEATTQHVGDRNTYSITRVNPYAARLMSRLSRGGVEIQHPSVFITEGSVLDFNFRPESIFHTRGEDHIEKLSAKVIEAYSTEIILGLNSIAATIASRVSIFGRLKQLKEKELDQFRHAGAVFAEMQRLAEDAGYNYKQFYRAFLQEFFRPAHHDSKMQSELETILCKAFDRDNLLQSLGTEGLNWITPFFEVSTLELLVYQRAVQRTKQSQTSPKVALEPISPVPTVENLEKKKFKRAINIMAGAIIVTIIGLTEPSSVPPEFIFAYAGAATWLRLKDRRALRQWRSNVRFFSALRLGHSVGYVDGQLRVKNGFSELQYTSKGSQ